MEKRRATYDLKSIQGAFLDRKNLGRATTATAFRGAQEAGVSRADMIEIIQALQASDFYKSMTAYADSHIWQDVYHARFGETELYIKFTVQPNAQYLLLSFKDR